ncbi:hypothetical protein [Klebsiella grimontii]|uniref:hypothetical protein n=1 Tax=Klebsiella grimontii TaxID=2058152 RepID=UPI0039EF402D
MSIKLSSSLRSKLAAQNIARVIGADPDLTIRFAGRKMNPRIDMVKKIYIYLMVTLVMINTGSYALVGLVMKVVIIVLLN